MKKTLENLLARNASGSCDLSAEEAATLARLVSFFEVVEQELPAALSVPSWENHDDSSEPDGYSRLGTVCATYAAWIEEDPCAEVGEHDGVQQLAEVARALPRTIDLLESLSKS